MIRCVQERTLRADNLHNLKCIGEALDSRLYRPVWPLQVLPPPASGARKRAQNGGIGNVYLRLMEAMAGDAGDSAGDMNR